MKAIVYERYGPPDVLHLTDLETPTPGEDDVLVRVKAAAVSAGDWHLMRGDPILVRLMFGLRKPKIRVLGSDVSGRVEAVGHNVKEFRPGDEVFGHLSECGFGGFAEYVCVPATALVEKPAHTTFEEAAAVPGSALAALQGLRDRGQLLPGQQVLVNGASGGVGSFAVQIAKSFGAEVTGVCSTRNLDLVRGLGADHVIDYTKQDFTRTGKRYDLILDAAAYRPLWDHLRALTSDGVYVLVGGAMVRTLQVMILGPFVSLVTRKKAVFFITKPNRTDMTTVKDLVEADSLRSVIDRRYALAGVPDAVRHVEAGHARGKVVITM